MKIMEMIKSRPGAFLAPLILVPIIIILELLLVWSGIPNYLLPTPSSIFKEFVIELMNGLILKHALVTLSEALFGFFVAFVIGISLAVVVNRSEIIKDVLQPYVTAFQAMPKVAIAPIIVLWFGFGVGSKIVLVILITFFIVFVNALSGLRSLSTPVLELMRSYRATEGQILFKVRFPNALPFIFAGAEAALLYSFTAAVVGEFVGAREGLGYLIQLWSMQFRADSSFAAILMLVIIALTMNLALTYVRNKVLFWAAKT